MLLVSSDGREFSLTDSEYERFLVRFGECELIEVDDSDGWDDGSDVSCGDCPDDEYEEDYEITSADLHDYMYGI